MIKRHVLAQVTVDVYRLFKVMDAASALGRSVDPVVNALGQQIHEQAETMARPYMLEQNEAHRLERERAERRAKRRSTSQVVRRNLKTKQSRKA